MPAINSDGQKTYERFIELVKAQKMVCISRAKQDQEDRHMSCHNERRNAFEQEESNSEIEDSDKCTDYDEVMPVFDNIFEIFKSPFVELE